MKCEHGKEVRLELHIEAAEGVKDTACKKACLYLLQKYTGGCEEFEGIYLYEGINGGAGRKGLLDESSEERSGR